MEIAKHIVWQDQGQWRGYLQDHPDRQVQGESFDDLQAKLWRLSRDLADENSSRLAAPRRVA